MISNDGLPVGALGISRLSRYGHVCNMAYAGKGLQTKNTKKCADEQQNIRQPLITWRLIQLQSSAHLSSESIGCNSWEILKSLEFAGGKPLTNDFHIFFLPPKQNGQLGQRKLQNWKTVALHSSFPVAPTSGVHISLTWWGQTGQSFSRVLFCYVLSFIVITEGIHDLAWVTLWKRPFHRRVTHPDASAVVLNLKELQSAFFHRHLDVGGLGIQTATF